MSPATSPISPFTNPAPRGQPPFWLREREEVHEVRQRELMAQLERLHRERREAQ